MRGLSQRAICVRRGACEQGPCSSQLYTQGWSASRACFKGQAGDINEGCKPGGTHEGMVGPVASWKVLLYVDWLIKWHREEALFPEPSNAGRLRERASWGKNGSQPLLVSTRRPGTPSSMWAGVFVPRKDSQKSIPGRAGLRFFPQRIL